MQACARAGSVYGGGACTVHGGAALLVHELDGNMRVRGCLSRLAGGEMAAIWSPGSLSTPDMAQSMPHAGWRRFVPTWLRPCIVPVPEDDMAVAVSLVASLLPVEQPQASRARTAPSSGRTAAYVSPWPLPTPEADLLTAAGLSAPDQDELDGVEECSEGQMDFHPDTVHDFVAEQCGVDSESDPEGDPPGDGVVPTRRTIARDSFVMPSVRYHAWLVFAGTSQMLFPQLLFHGT